MSIALARAVTQLPEQRIQSLFHALKREGEGLPGPSELEFTAWRERQQEMLGRMNNMGESRKDGLRSKLFRSRSEPVPDGAMFYAWSRIEARARQELVIDSVTDAVDLAPPGSQADQYELGPDGRPAKVYYASYGSNLSVGRFDTYLRGGTPEGSARTYTGCDDQTPPEDDIAIRFPGRPHFALTSRVWRGGIAFMDETDRKDPGALGRAYLISSEQFDQVVAQENGREPGDATPVPLTETITDGTASMGGGPYETLRHVGDYNGVPVVTFTAPFSTHDALTHDGAVTRANVRMPVQTNRPSAAYVRMIGSGLAETFGLDEVQQADYLRGCPGGDRWERRDLVKVLRGESATAAIQTAEARPVTSALTRPDEGHDKQERKVSRFAAPPAAAPMPSFYSAASSEHVALPGVNDRAHDRSRRGARATPRPVPIERRQDGTFYPGVKTYQTIDDQRTGQAYWKSTSTAASREVRRLQESLRLAKVMAERGHAPNEQVAHYEQRLKVAKEAQAEARAKLAKASRQAPQNYYAASTTKTVAEWARLYQYLGEQASWARKQARHLETEQSTGDATRDKAHRKAIAAAHALVVELDARLDEVGAKRDALVAGRPE